MRCHPVCQAIESQNPRKATFHVRHTLPEGLMAMNMAWQGKAQSTLGLNSGGPSFTHLVPRM